MDEQLADHLIIMGAKHVKVLCDGKIVSKPIYVTVGVQTASDLDMEMDAEG